MTASDYENPVFLTPETRAAVTARAVAAAKKVAESHGIRVDDPAVLADGYAIRVHLRPAPLVARVSTFTAVLRQPIDGWLAREIDVAAFLHDRGAPAVPPSDLLPPGPHLDDGFAVSFWSFVEPVSDEPPSADVAGKMLSELHRELREYPGELPRLAPPLNDIPRALERLERLPQVVKAEDLAMLRRAAERLLPTLDDRSAATQPLHGDAHVYNMISTKRGVLWNDFEDVCEGPVAWDLTNLTDPENKMLDAYPEAPPLETIEAYRRVRMLHGTVWVLALLPEVDQWAAHANDMLDAIRPFA